MLMQTACRPHGPGSSPPHSSTSVRTGQQATNEPHCRTYYQVSGSHFTPASLESPVHPTASGVKPTGQEQLSPTFTRPGGQPQAEPFSRVTWFPGHRGARLELGETVLREAAGVKNGAFFKMEVMNKSRETTEVKPTCGGRVAPPWFTETGCDVHSHLRLKADNKNSFNSSHSTHPTHTRGSPSGTGLFLDVIFIRVL